MQSYQHWHYIRQIYYSISRIFFTFSNGRLIPFAILSGEIPSEYINFMSWALFFLMHIQLVFHAFFVLRKTYMNISLHHLLGIVPFFPLIRLNIFCPQVIVEYASDNTFISEKPFVCRCMISLFVEM